MTVGKRPGGLTALAVINFVMAGFNAIGILGLVVVMTMGDALKQSATSAEDRAVFEALQHVGGATWGIIILANVISGALVIIAGIGYLKMRRWARMLGNLYAVFEISAEVGKLLLLPTEIGGFGIGTLIGLVYPVLTLIFINLTFKDDLTN
jgi:hypothetical protein